MKAMLTLSLFFLLTKSLFAPEYSHFDLYRPAPYKPFLPLIYAVGMVESKLDTLAFNPSESAVGYFQIRPVRVRDFNNLTGKDYTLKDMYDYRKAEEVFLFYAMRIVDFEQVSKKWNGSGFKVIAYWQKVQKEMLKFENI